MSRRLVATDPGPMLAIDPDSAFGIEVLGTRTYEPRLTSLLRTVLRGGDTFVDIGANEGWFSLLAARLLGPAGRVVAVEPQAEMRAVLARNLACNGCAAARRRPLPTDPGAGAGRAAVTIVPCALMGEAGAVRLHVAGAANPGATSIHGYQGELPTRRVDAIPLDALWSRERVGVARLVKVDVEGAEGEVIAGAEHTLASGLVHFLALEYHTNILPIETCLAIDARLRSLGLRLSKVRGLHVYHRPDCGDELRAHTALEPVKPDCDWHGGTRGI